MTEPGDDAFEALQALAGALDSSIVELQSARQRVSHLMDARGAGKPWREIVEAEDPPLVVETLSTVLDRLAVVGSRFRRLEARALYGDGLSMERIATMFGVTRQRVSALLRDREGPEPTAELAPEVS
jgi:hypothetical protein